MCPNLKVIDAGQHIRGLNSQRLGNSNLNEREPNVARWVWRAIGEEDGSISAVITQINPWNLAGNEIRLPCPGHINLYTQSCMGHEMGQRIETRAILVKEAMHFLVPFGCRKVPIKVCLKCLPSPIPIPVSLVHPEDQVLKKLHVRVAEARRCRQARLECSRIRSGTS